MKVVATNTPGEARQGDVTRWKAGAVLFSLYPLDALISSKARKSPKWKSKHSSFKKKKKKLRKGKNHVRVSWPIPLF